MLSFQLAQHAVGHPQLCFNMTTTPQLIEVLRTKSTFAVLLDDNDSERAELKAVGMSLFLQSLTMALKLNQPNLTP